MTTQFWVEPDGVTLIVDDDGKPILCSDCPCTECGGDCTSACTIIAPGEGDAPTTTPYTAIGGVWWGVFSSIGDNFTVAAATGVTVTAYHGTCGSLTMYATGTTSITFNTLTGNVYVELSGTVTTGTLTVTNNTPP